MIHRAIAGAALAATLFAGAAIAQAPVSQPPATPPARTNSVPPAVDIQPNANANAPLPGANSFTEEQARDRIERAGMSAVTGLTLDDKGVWRGKAVRGADPVDVSVDYRGNVVAR